MDCSKASDTIDHVILLEKLKLYHLGDNSVLWPEDYLDNRQHNANIRKLCF